jgi:hypothetical protein
LGQTTGINFYNNLLLDCCLYTFAQMSHYKHFLKKSVAKTKKVQKKNTPAQRIEPV